MPLGLAEYTRSLSSLSGLWVSYTNIETPEQINPIEELKLDYSLHPAWRPNPPVANISSLLSFINYVISIPRNVLGDFVTFEDAMITVQGVSQDTLIGKGGSFSVRTRSGAYLPKELIARLPQLKKGDSKIVAIKIPRIEKDGAAFSKDVESRSLKAVAWECHVLFHPQVRRCPNIVTLLGISWESIRIGSITGKRLVPGLIMEYANEGTLTDYWNPDAYCLSYPVKRGFVLDVARGLETLHRHGIVHGDIKSDNILLFSDDDGNCTAKIADFGCSVNDFGPKGMVQFPGMTPPWDSPEASRGTIAVAKLFQADLYSFGLLVWRLMLEGQTPFDPTAPINYRGFEFLSQLKSREEQLQAISRLKRSPDDQFLTLVLATIGGYGLDELELKLIFESTLRLEPDLRIDGFTQLITTMESGQTRVLCENQSNEDVQSALLQVEARTLNQTQGKPVHLNQNVPRYQLWETMNDPSRNRISYGLGAVGHDMVEIVERISERNLPEALRQQIFEDFRTLERDSEVELSLGICHLLGFGTVVNPCLGLSLVTRAAENDNLRAKAIVKPLHDAYNELLSPQTPILKWLVSAVEGGSRIASEHLAALDPELHRSAIEVFLLTPVGEETRVFDDRVVKVLEDFCISDPVSCRKALQEILSHSEDPLSDRENLESLVGGYGFLHFAAYYGFCGTVTMLLDLGFNINRRTILNDTPLLIACRHGRYDAANVLLERQADPTLYNLIGANPLHYLIYFDDSNVEDMARSLVESGADINMKACMSRPATRNTFIAEDSILDGTPLHWAVSTNRALVVDTLLQLGARAFESDISSEFVGTTGLEFKTDPKFSSPIHLAASNLRAEMLKLFVKHRCLSGTEEGLFPNVESLLSVKPFVHQCIHSSRYKENFSQTLDILRKGRPAAEILALAVNNDLLSLTEDMIEETGNVNAILPVIQMTPLQVALTSHNQNGQMPLFLLRKGANPLLRSPNFQCSTLTVLALRPLSAAIETTTKALLSAGVEYRTEREAFRLLYHRAVREGWDELAIYLLSHVRGEEKRALESGLIPSLLTQNSSAGMDALLFLLEPRHSHPDGRAYLGASPATGKTHLHHLLAVPKLVRDDDLSCTILDYLLAKCTTPVEIDALDKRGGSAIALAVENGHARAVAMLLKRGADPYVGRISAVMAVIDRGCDPPFESIQGTFKGVPKKYHEAARVWDNSKAMLRNLLEWWLANTVPIEQVIVAGSLARSVEEEFQDALPGWCSRVFQEQVMTRAICSTEAVRNFIPSEPQVDAQSIMRAIVRKDGIYIESSTKDAKMDGGTEKILPQLHRRRATFDETKIGCMDLWQNICCDWKQRRTTPRLVS